MEKRFKGITKEMLSNISIGGNGVIYIDYIDTFDVNSGLSRDFPDQIEVEDTQENREVLCEAFDLVVCWCTAINKHGKEIRVEEFADSYETFYEWFDYVYGLDVLDDGDE